jgi:hypothetical protein
MPGAKRPRSEPEFDPYDPRLQFVIAGCGAGATAVYDGATSSTFLLRCVVGAGDRAGGGNTTTTTTTTTTTPLLIVDLGFGARRALAAHVDNGDLFPAQAPSIFISHNHSDHSAELPVVAAVERARREKPLVVFAEKEVAKTLKEHRLDELRSTGSSGGIKHFVDLRGLNDNGRGHSLALWAPAFNNWTRWELGAKLVRAAHSERCCGFVLMARRQARVIRTAGGRLPSPPWKPLLGWSADSAASADVYRALARAPLVVLDARPGAGTPEHAGIEEVVRMAAEQGGPLARVRRVVVYGYGGEAERRRAEAELQQALAAAGRGGGGGGDGGGGGGGSSCSSSSSSPPGQQPPPPGPSIEIARPGMVLEVPWPRKG